MSTDGDTTPGAREGIDAANRMTDVLGDFAAELKKLTKRDRRVRLILRFLAVSFLVDIGITVGLGVTSVQTRANSAAIHQSQLAGCQYNNVRLARQEQSLDAILQPSHGGTAAQRAAATRYLTRARAEVAIAWAPRDCTQAYSLNGH